MDIDHAVGESPKQVVGHQQQEACQDEVVDAPILKEMQDIVGLEEIVTVEVLGVDTQLLGTGGHIGVTLVIDNHIDPHIVALGEIFRYLLGIGAVARCEDSQLNRFLHS